MRSSQRVMFKALAGVCALLSVSLLATVFSGAAGAQTLPPKFDFTGSGHAEPAVYRDGAWFVAGAADVWLGLAGDIPVPADYDGDGQTERALYRPSVGAWFIEGQAQPTYWGLSTDIPVPADYDGDGDDDIAVYRPQYGGWYFQSGAPTVFHGLSTDVPVPADYDGDGDDDITIYRPEVGGWYFQSGAPTQFFGLSTDVPLPADYDGDGDDDITIFRPEVGGWYFQSGAPTQFYGSATDVPVPADYDGDGDSEPAVYRDGAWLIQNQDAQFLGLDTDIPLLLPYATRNYLDSISGPPAGDVLFRVNVGGPELAGTPVWSADSFDNESPYNVNPTNFFSTSDPVDITDPSIPGGTPMAMFQDQRYDAAGGTPMQWSFPVAPGEYQVRLHFAELYAPLAAPGARVFDVQAEGATVLEDMDIGAATGGAAFKGVTRTFNVIADSSLDLTWVNQTENPAVEGIEILTTDGSGSVEPSLGANVSSVTFPVTSIGDTATQSVTVTNTGGNGAGPLDITGATITGTDSTQFSTTLAAPVTLDRGETTTFDVQFAPTTSGVKAAALEIAHTGSNPTITIPLGGTAPSGDGATVVYRVNAGGPQVAGTPVWSADTAQSPSPFALNGAVYNSGQTVDISDLSIPAGTPASIFTDERYDGANTQWRFPTGAGDYQVRLYFAETSPAQSAAGARVMDVTVENSLVLDDFDQFVESGGANKGIMRSFDVTATAEGGDAQPDIEVSLASVVDVPALKAIEIVIPPEVPDRTISANPQFLSFGTTTIGQTQTRTVTLTHLGPDGVAPVQITNVEIVGPWAESFTETFNEANPPTLNPDGTTTFDVSHVPATTGVDSVTLRITHNGANSPLEIPVTGNGAYGGGGSGISFGKSAITGLDGPNSPPTALKWGPDDRLYVARLDGTIQVATVQRTGANAYNATGVQTITSIRDIQNHDDSGVVNNNLQGRMVTGLEVLGTAQNPKIYLVSSDPRIGSPQTTETAMDTNSGILSSLTWNGTSWVKRDLVRGLPRSKEQHSVQGVILNPANGHLLLMSGGNTNNGAPSGNFKNLPEYALTSAILDLDIAAVEAMPGTYDIPTLDDEDRPGVNDANDPFGGNNGKNQAKLVPGGPVQLYATGFRNAYDAVVTSKGLYTIDNGGNNGWGGAPANEGPTGVCTNAIDNGGQTYQDGLHHLTGPGYYGGHPNPTRANMANTFNVSNPQSPVSVADPIECDFRDNDSRGALAHFTTSTNGVAQYTTDNFGGAMQGDLIAAGWDNMVHRIQLNSDGTAAKTSQLFQNVGAFVLDVIASPSTAPYPGTILAADYGDGSVYIYEPQDVVCTGTDSTQLDDDGDGFSNADEIDNGTNPCSAGDVPADFDNDLVSNLNDPDDDNDGILDVNDRFAVDAGNGLTTPIPVDFPWDSDTPQNGKILNLGITGSMTNGTTDWLSTYEPTNMTIIGAAGVVTVDEVPNGDALNGANNQQYGLQVGFDARPANANTFEASTSLPNPFGSHAPLAGHSWGLQVGTGTQSNYMKIVASGANGGQMQLVREVNDVATVLATAPVPMPGPERIDVYLRVDPDTKMAQAFYTVVGGGGTGAKTALGDPFTVPTTWFDQGMAAGLIATSGGAASPLTASWDFLKVLSSPGTIAPPAPAAIVEPEQEPQPSSTTSSTTSTTVAPAPSGSTTTTTPAPRRSSTTTSTWNRPTAVLPPDRK